MGKDELGDALMDFSKHIHVATLSNMGGAHACESYARDAEQYLMEAKSAILAWFLDNLPKNDISGKVIFIKDFKRGFRANEDFTEGLKYGYEKCLAEIKRRMGAKEKYGATKKYSYPVEVKNWRKGVEE